MQMKLELEKEGIARMERTDAQRERESLRMGRSQSTQPELATEPTYSDDEESSSMSESPALVAPAA